MTYKITCKIINKKTYELVNKITINSDSLKVLKTYPDNHFDLIVSDPPYGISYRTMDSDECTILTNTYRECIRVLKPGGRLLAFAADRPRIRW